MLTQTGKPTYDCSRRSVFSVFSVLVRALTGFPADEGIVQHHESCAAESSAHYICKPVHPRDQSSYYHESDKKHNCRRQTPFQNRVSDAGVQLHDPGGHNAHDEHGCGGWIGRFQASFNQYRSVIYRNPFKQEVYCQYKDVKNPPRTRIS